MKRSVHPVSSAAGRLGLWLVIVVFSPAGFPTMTTAATAATVAPSAPAHETGPAGSTSLQELAVALSTLFPSVSGTVTAAQGDRVDIDRGLDQGVRPGLLLNVVRPGEPFRHPLTGVMLGASETRLGLLVVESATADRAVTRWVGAARSSESASASGAGPASSGEAVGPIRAGDQIRTSDQPLPIVLASTAAGQFLTTRFRAALDDTGRFRLLPFATSIPVPSLIGDASFPMASAAETAPLVEATRELGADYVVVFDVRLRPSGVMGGVAIMETRRGGRLDAVQMPLHLNPDELPAGAFEGPATAAADAMVQVMAARTGRAFRTMEFPYRAEHVVIGDLDGTGGTAVAISDGHRLRIYSLKHSTTELLAEEPLERADRRQLAVDLADINGEGRPQLFVTAMVDDRLDSYVLRWKDGKLTRVVEHQPYYFRVLTPPDKPAMLVGQKRSISSPFYDRVMTLEWTGQGYREGETLTLPDDVAIYDFTVADFTRDGRGQLLYLDRSDRLVLVAPDGRVLGKSADSFGGVESFIEYRPIAINQGADSEPLRARIPARLTAADLEGDGTVEVAVPHNVPLTKRIERIKGYQYGQIHVLRWDGQQFVEQWTVPRVEGVIADIAVARLLGTGGGTQVMVLVNPTAKEKVSGLKELFSTQSQLLFYLMPHGSG